MEEPKSRAEMGSDALREVGVLTVVFGPLDAIEAGFHGWEFVIMMIASLILGGVFLLLGMRLEERRPRQP